jgi:hypothetical protein
MAIVNIGVGMQDLASRKKMRNTKAGFHMLFNESIELGANPELYLSVLFFSDQ